MVPVEGNGALTILGLGHQPQVRFLVDNRSKPGTNDRVIVGHKDLQPLLAIPRKFVHHHTKGRGAPALLRRTGTLKKEREIASSNSPYGEVRAGPLGWVDKLVQAWESTGPDLRADRFSLIGGEQQRGTT